MADVFIKNIPRVFSLLGQWMIKTMVLSKSADIGEYDRICTVTINTVVTSTYMFKLP